MVASPFVINPTSFTVSLTTPRGHLVGPYSSNKGPVIKYREGVATKWEKSLIRNFVCPLSRQGNTFCTPPLFQKKCLCVCEGVGDFLHTHTPSPWLKLQAPVLKLPQNVVPRPFSMPTPPPSPRMHVRTHTCTHTHTPHTHFVQG